jgi:hypothetical protein
MQTNTPSRPDSGGRSSRLRLGALIFGYLIALFGVLSIVTIPFAVSLLAMIAGPAAVTLASRGVFGPPRVTWQAGLAWAAGSVVIFGLLWLIGEDRVRHWRPFPAFYPVAWWLCLCAFRHLRQVLHPESTQTKAA